MASWLALASSCSEDRGKGSPSTPTNNAKIVRPARLEKAVEPEIAVPRLNVASNVVSPPVIARPEIQPAPSIEPIPSTPTVNTARAEALFNEAVQLLSPAGGARRKEAAERLLEAANAGHVGAQHNLGVLYLHGSGVASNKDEAARWFRKAADQGFGEAQFKLSLLESSRGRMPLEETADWLARAGSQGHVEAAYQLAVLQLQGVKGPPNPVEASKWFRLAAERGHAKSQVNLGVLLFHGQAGVTNRAEAVTWYRRAADQGNAAAQFNLGSALARGEGIDRDLVSGYFWHALASAQGDRDAAELMKRLRDEMSPEQLMEGIKRVTAHERAAKPAIHELPEHLNDELK